MDRQRQGRRRARATPRELLGRVALAGIWAVAETLLLVERVVASRRDGEAPWR